MLIETERLLLRPIEAGDLDEFAALHEDPEVTRFIRPLDRAQAKRRLEGAEREWAERGYGMFAVLARDDRRFLGRAGLKHWDRFGEDELGWVLRREGWGRGYATEAARACAEWAFSNFEMPYVTAMIEPANHASIRVAERLGMTPLRSDVLLGVPVTVYALRRPA